MADTPQDDNVTQRIPIPKDLAPVLIGQKGKYIEAMRQDTGCGLHIQHAQDEQSYWSTVVIRGPRAGVWHAMKRIIGAAYTCQPRAADDAVTA